MNLLPALFILRVMNRAVNDAVLQILYQGGNHGNLDELCDLCESLRPLREIVHWLLSGYGNRQIVRAKEAKTRQGRKDGGFINPVRGPSQTASPSNEDHRAR